MTNPPTQVAKSGYWGRWAAIMPVTYACLKESAVDLHFSKIPILLTVDWYLDRCRATINVLGDVNVACLLDGRTKQPSGESGSRVKPI